MKTPGEINVLSCFDGISCAQIALNRAGIHYDNYYASEINKFAIKVTQKNYPNTIQLGDIRNIDIKSLPKFDYVFAGSPCTGFSRAGLGLNFEDDESKLFFDFVKIWNYLKIINPDIKIIFENVPMKKEWRLIISQALGLRPLLINAGLVSAQARQRLYWSNINLKFYGLYDDKIPNIPLPINKNIYLSDILQPENEIDPKYYISQTALNRILRKGYSQPKINPDKIATINKNNNSSKLNSDSGTVLISDRGTGRSYIQEYDKVSTFLSRPGCVFDHLLINTDGDLKNEQNKISKFTAGAHSGGLHSQMDLILVGDTGKNSQGSRIYHTAGKCVTISSRGGGQGAKTGLYQITKTNIRRLTPIEVERAFTIPDNYTEGISDSRRYECLGNSWVSDVIVHILSFLNK